MPFIGKIPVATLFVKGAEAVIITYTRDKHNISQLNKPDKHRLVD